MNIVKMGREAIQLRYVVENIPVTNNDRNNNDNLQMIMKM